MVDEGNLRVDKFNGQNFQLWKMQMEDYLYQKDLWKLLERKIKNRDLCQMMIGMFYTER